MFRSGAEERIRTKLLKDGSIYTVIDLPTAVHPRIEVTSRPVVPRHLARAPCNALSWANKMTSPA